jgi:ubiquinol-cytochrome c reductase iron-sulfur subunit
MSRVKDALVSAVVLLVGRAAPSARPDREPLVEQGSPSPGWEVVVLILLALVAGCAIVFMVLFSFEGLAHQTQYLGLALGAAFVLLAAICIVVANKLIVTEELEEDYPDLEHSAESDDVEQVVVDSGSRFTRGRLVKLAGFGALGTLGLALITPALSLGPAFATQKLKWTPWRRGRRLVDSQGAPLKASDIEAGSFYTAYPEGADRELIGSPIVVVRVPLADLKSRHDWAPQGIVAFSKICTHAGCAISLYRKPTFVPVEPRPALVCPCHYSTFDPADGGKVIFGPAGRALPQLPLAVDAKGYLRAQANFDEPIGPSWWGVRKGKAYTT